MTSLPVRRMVAGVGVDLAVCERGTAGPETPTVVLVHGWPDSKSLWRPIAKRLAMRYHVVAYDVRGAGSSTHPTGTDNYRVELLVEDLAAVIAATSPDRPVHLVGHDWGAVQGWEAVTTDRLAGQLLSFTSISGPSLDHSGYGVRDHVKADPRALARLVDQLARFGYVLTFNTPVVPGLLRRLGPGGRLRSVAYDAAHGIEMYRANILERLLRPHERRTEVPVQMIEATRDPVVRKASLDCSEQWTANMWRRPLKAGHWSVRSHPTEIAQWIQEFVDHIEGGPEPESLQRARVRRAGTPIRARRASFDLSGVARHWIPGDPQTTHLWNVLHVALPPGERWFTWVMREALPFIRDVQLRDDVRGFIGQENTHARAHDVALDHLAKHGLDFRPAIRATDTLMNRVTPVWRSLPGPLYRSVLHAQLAGVAAIEHFTSWMGDWAFNDPERRLEHALAVGGADPTVVQLFLWHGAEELEHSTVAFDVFQAVSGNYALRVTAMLLAASGLTVGLVVGSSALMLLDPEVRRPVSARALLRAGRQGRFPQLRPAFRDALHYCRPSHHPSQIFATENATAYLATAPGVLTRGVPPVGIELS